VFDLDAALRETVRLGGSDLHLKVPSPPHVRIEGKLGQLEGYGPLQPGETEELKEKLLNSEVKRAEYANQGYADFSYYTGDCRFRVAAFSQRGSASFVFRAIAEAPKPDGLRIPEVALTWADAQRGLIFVTGPTGQGKSTTTAVLVGLVNERRACHITTIEDPIEFIYSDDQALISQREIGSDAPSSIEALRGSLRQDADVMLIGEVRDEDTAIGALRAAETGHLVLCTMHTNDAGETIQRFIDLFAPRDHTLARQMLAATLVGSISQRLIPGTDGARVLNAEVLVNTTRIRDLITEGKPVSAFHEAIGEGEYYGMQTFDQDLMAHLQAGRIAADDAMSWAMEPHDFKLMLSGNVAPRTSLHA
jgi:twitching motility protein PilT